LAKTVKRGGDILNWFSRNVTNGILEGLNPSSSPSRERRLGFGNVEYFKAMIFPRTGRMDFSVQFSVSSATY
jgi:transposase